MADGNDDDDLQHSLSHMIEYVGVKIGEKFKPPARISLPFDWKPCDPTSLLSFQYNFAKEREVIRRAEEERLIQLHSNNAAFSGGESQCDNDYSDNEDIVCDNANDNNDDSDSSNPSSDINVSEILTPMVVLSEEVKNGQMPSDKKINVEEFEDNNQNPFELVELQTLNEFDELRSVLEPSAQVKNKKRESKKLNDIDDFELDATFFTQTNPPPSFTSENYIISLSKETAIYTSSVNADSTAASAPSDVSKGSTDWVTFTNPLSCSATQPSSINNSALNNAQSAGPTSQVIDCLPSCQGNSAMGQPAMMAPEFMHPNYSVYNEQYEGQVIQSSHSSVSNIGMIFSSVHCADIVTRKESKQPRRNLSEDNGWMGVSMHTSKSVPELNGPSEFLHGKANCLPLNIDQTQVENSITTDRIDSIMKQYQFQRLSNIPASFNFSATNTSLNSNLCSPLPHYVGSREAHNMSMSTVMESYSKALPFSNSNEVQSIQSSRIVSEPNMIYNDSYRIPTLSNDVKKNNLAQNSILSNFQSNPTAVSNPYSASNTKHPFLQPILQNNNSPQPGVTLATLGILPVHAVNDRGSTYSVMNSASRSSNVAPSSMTTPRLPELDLRVSKASQLSIVAPNSNAISKPKSICLSSNIQPHNNNTMLNLPNDVNGITEVISPPKDQLTWLVDPTESLSSEHKKFAYQLSAMGFPLPCVSRAILRLGADEKEVLDFLCMVQELKEKNFHGDDIEMALVNLQDDKDKITSYLEMVATFKELGFKPLQIHNALKETSCDQQKALDYLTT